MKVAIVHDWLYGGGAEKVVEELHKLYPDAPIYTSYCSDEWRQRLDNKVITGYLQHWPFSAIRRLAIISSFLRIRWFGSIDFSGYDLVISSKGNGEANDINVPSGTKHIMYCNTPIHYYWRKYQQYLKDPGFGPLNFAAKFALRYLVGPFRRRDYAAAQKPDYIIANSNFIAEEIKKSYDRDSFVINPPVSIERFESVPRKPGDMFVTIGRQVLYKKVDVIIEACNKLKLPLTVAGHGPDHDRLVRLAGPTITFDTEVSDQKVAEYLGIAKAFIFAAEEDFGIAPVEALAAGCPVIAYKKGGSPDYIKPGKTGEFFNDQTAESLAKVLQTFDAKKYKDTELRKFAEQFSSANFQKKIKQFITQKMAAK